MNEKEAFELAVLITRYFRQELTPEEETYFLKLIESDPEKQALLDTYKGTAEMQQRLAEMDKLDLEAAWASIIKKRTGKKKILKIKWLGYAAACMLVGFISLWWIVRSVDRRIVKDNRYGYKNDVLPGENGATLTLSDGKKVHLGEAPKQLKEKDGTQLSGHTGYLEYLANGQGNDTTLLYNTLTVPKSGTYRVVLPDGTKVWINALSALRFPVKVGSHERTVYLRGEAYFEIKDDPSKPFKVLSNEREITVLGTSFDVSSYEDRFMTTILVDGAIQVTSGEQSVRLSPGKQSVLMNGRLEVGIADLEKATAWRDGYFYFNHENIQSIMEQLSRWYDLEINYDDRLPVAHYGGSISRQVRLSEVLEMLKDVTGFKFEIDGRTVTVKNR